MAVRWMGPLGVVSAVMGMVAVAGCAMATAPTGAVDVVLPTTSPFPESVTAAADGTVFVSSISHGGVLKIAPGASAAVPFFLPGEHGTRSTFGVLADDRHGLLWVTSNDATGIGLPGPSTVAGSWVKGFDLRTGALKVSARLPGAPTVANDVAVADDGTLYITNTAAPQVLRLKPGAQAIEVFVQDDALKGGLDGIALGRDGHLYVNTYFSGELFRIEVRDGAPGRITKLQTSRPLQHADGLRPFKDGFLMVEGAGPLSRVTIEGDTARIETLAQLNEPTGVGPVGDRAWISEGQLSYLGAEKKGQLPANFKVRAVPLP